MKSDLSISTPGILSTPGLFYSSNWRFARVSQGKNQSSYRQPFIRFFSHKRNNSIISGVDRMNYSILASQNQKRPQNIEIIGRSHNEALVAPDALKTRSRFFKAFLKAFRYEITQNDQG